MSGYKAGYSESKSPAYATGREDGQADAWRVMCCPPNPPTGPMPPDPDHRAMYDRGYKDGYGGAMPHLCTDKCKGKGAERMQDERA